MNRLSDLERRIADLESRLAAHIQYGSHAQYTYGFGSHPNTTFTAISAPCPDCATRQPCSNAACPLMPKVTS